jgi:hypothetical protein
LPGEAVIFQNSYHRRLLTRVGRGKVQKLRAEIRDFRQSWFDVVLEVLHGHGAQIIELVSHLIGPSQVGSGLDVAEDALYFVENLKRRKQNSGVKNLLVSFAISIYVPLRGRSRGASCQCVFRKSSGAELASCAAYPQCPIRRPGGGS